VGIVLEITGWHRETDFGSPATLSIARTDIVMTTADALTFPVTASGDAPEFPWVLVRRGLTITLIVIGALLTLWLLYNLGPVAYGLPAPFFRRGPVAPVGV
jgi:hypothetical protein